MFQQYQDEYDRKVSEYLDEALYALSEEYRGCTVAALHKDVIVYLECVTGLPWYRLSGRKVAVALMRYRVKVTELLSA